MSSANQLAEPLAFAGSRDKLIISRRLASSQDLPSLLRLAAELASSRIYTFTYTPLPPFLFPFPSRRSLPFGTGNAGLRHAAPTHRESCGENRVFLFGSREPAISVDATSMERIADDRRVNWIPWRSSV